MKLSDFTIGNIKSINAQSINAYDTLFCVESSSLDTLKELSDYIKENDSNLNNNNSIKKQTNCPNCGAPITSYKCEYCGTRF